MKLESRRTNAVYECESYTKGRVNGMMCYIMENVKMTMKLKGGKISEHRFKSVTVSTRGNRVIG